MGYNARCVTRCWGMSDARWRCQERGAVQLCELRSAGAIGSSLAADPEDCGRGAGCTDGGIREAVRQVRLPQAGGGCGVAMPGICQGPAKTGKINAKACLKRGFQQPQREFRMRTRQSASRAL